MRVKVAAAPVSWGVSELATLPREFSVDLVLDQMVAAGYAGTELGPPGFLGDADAVRERLSKRGMELVGAFLPMRFSRPEHRTEDLAWLSRMLELLDHATVGRPRPKAILADASVEPDRLALAGRIATHPEATLPPRRFRILVDALHRAAELCQRQGFDAVLHPHAGSYVETDAEIRAVLDVLDPAVVGLCLDTGHLALGGADPPTVARDYADRVRHVHLKDLDQGVLDRVVGQGGDFGALVRAGVFAELGAGDAAVRETVETLLELGYRGWFVVEQDRTIADADIPASLLAAQERNRRFLSGFGL
jgi:inosose dehydratase